jgi:hypothetical protein
MPRKDRLWRATSLIAQAAKDMMPSGEAVIELILLSAVTYCVKDLKLSTKEACDLIDARLCSLFEKLGRVA